MRPQHLVPRPPYLVSEPDSDVPAISPYVAGRLLELCIALATPRDIADVLAVILDATTDLLDCGRASLLLYDTSARQLRFVAATSEETEALAQIPVPLHGSLAGTIFRENRALVAADVQRDTRHFAEPAEQAGYRPRAIAGVPLCIDGVPIGVLEALDPHDGAFAETDVDVLMAVAAQAAVAVHAARQRHALERAHARLAELDRLKGRLLALAGHEIGQPLEAVREAAGALRETFGEAADAPVAAILGAAARVQALVRSVSEVGAMPEADAPPGSEPVVLQGLVREASHEAHAAVRVVLDLPHEPILISAHMRRLRLALVHLIAQAAATAASGSEDGGEVTVRVGADGGDAVVEVAVHEAPASPDDGDGLDLLIARVLVEPDGGLVWGAAGGGAHLRLPLSHGPAPR